MIHIKQIDGLRCVAIGMVLVTHWGVSKVLPIPFGTMGVNLFFVISGFLITLILLDLKEIRETQKTSLFQLLKTFYIRRSLRIFPIYYLTILVCLIFGVYPIYEFIGWLLTYTFNIKACFSIFGTNVFSHFWSLAVEEQFYLFCPVFVLIIPRKHLVKFFTGMILVGVISRFFFNYSNIPQVREGFIGYQLTICCFDSFGFGGLLAYLFLYFPNDLSRFIRKFFWLFGISLVGFFLVEVVIYPDYTGGTTLARFLFSATCFGVIGYASLGNGFSGITGRFLENPVVLYIGKISYGIYIYHNFVGYFFGYYVNEIYLRLFLRISMTFLIAAVSWKFFELPVNRLKERFLYSKPEDEIV